MVRDSILADERSSGAEGWLAEEDTNRGKKKKARYLEESFREKGGKKKGKKRKRKEEEGGVADHQVRRPWAWTASA